MFRSTLPRTFFAYKKFFAGVTVLFVVLAALYLVFFHATAHAQSAGGVVTGTGWSNTIGWLVLNSTTPGTSSSVPPYGVTFTGSALTGEAWNRNVGWISFNGDSICGSAPQVNASGVVTGFAAVLSMPVTSTRCINLGATGHNDGVTLSNGTLSGHAWGGSVLGWVNVSGSVSSSSCTPPPTSPTCIDNNTSSTYINNQCQTITTSCPNGCDPSTGQCKPPCQPITPPIYSCNGNFSIANNQCQQTSTWCPNGCDPSTGQCKPFPPRNSQAQGCLSIGPVNWPTAFCIEKARIDAGTTATLYWYTTMQSVNNCTLTESTSGGTTVIPIRPPTAHGSYATLPINGDTNYTIDCSGGGQQFNSSVAITLVPKVIEK